MQRLQNKDQNYRYDFKVENVHTQAKRFCATPIPEKGIEANEAN